MAMEGFLKSEELRKALVAHPDLPVVFLCAYDICGSEYDLAPACAMQVRVGKILDVPDSDTFEMLFTDEEEDDLKQALQHDYNCDPFVSRSKEKSEKAIEEEIEKYKPYWKECIIVKLGV